MNTKHTEGPWKVRMIRGDCFVEGAEVVGQSVAGFYRREIMSDEQYPKKLADANLIAAAPDLLEALELFVYEPDIPYKERLRRALAAISKAKGET